ncbi:uncharacterized protein LOC109834978 [Asparagus officinalis]|uniref:uncharacterized protein LOC109834978 n=1 Tax=Asparagus officinalis TaxID=4686 RepID=UPI00098E00C3|nr:uncharacterized protein LOC109834978 [Asparagus officinalis]
MKEGDRVRGLSCDISPLPKWPSAWCPPAPGLLKRNTNVIVPLEGDIIGLGSVIRDYHGHVIDCYSIGIMGPMYVDHAELLVVLEGVRFVRRMNWRVSVMKINSLKVVSLVDSPSPFVSLVPIVDKVHAGLTVTSCSKIFYVRRTGNDAVHFLAKLADYLSSCF